MKKIALKDLDMAYYYEKLENGLEVFLLPYPNKKNYYVTYATKFGSLHTEFVPLGEKKMVKVPDGIAHFLEHKMFEQENGEDPFTFYGKSGTGANASTSFDSTQYLFYGNQKLNENLDYLLDYVSEPYYTDENVEKEKGIIAQEIKMYDDIPEWALTDELRRNIFKESPMRVDIAGTVESINTITKEDLYRCYRTYYHPENMFLIAAGNFDPEEIMELIRENQKKKEKRPKFKVKEKKVDEPREVNCDHSTLLMNVTIPKVGIGFKFDRNLIPNMDDNDADRYLSMIVTLLFGSTSLFREEVRTKQYATSFAYERDHYENYRTLFLLAETDRIEEYLDYVKKTLSKVSFTEEDMKRIQKVWIASEVRLVDTPESTVDNLFSDLVSYGKVISDRIDRIRAMKWETLMEVWNVIDFTNQTTVIVRPKETKDK